MTWPRAKVGDVLTLKYGKALKAEDRDGGVFPVVGSGGVAGSHSASLTGAPAIVVGRKGSIGSLTYLDTPCWPIDTAYYVEVDQSRFDLRWIYWAMGSLNLGAMNKSAAVPGLNRDDVYRLELSTPPLPEQRRIASILDEASSITAKCDAQKSLFREASSAIFMSMFGDPLQTSRHASAVPLSTVTEAIIDCPHTTPTWTDTGVLCLRTSNLGLGEWDFSEARYVSAETHEVRTRRAVLKPGDLILSREGTIGVGAIVEPDMMASMGQRLVQIRPDTTLVLPEFLLAYLLVVLQPSRLTQLLVGSTSRHLNVRDIRALPVDVPSIDRQREFSEAVRVIRAQRRSIDAQTKLAEELLQAVQDRAFRGEL